MVDSSKSSNGVTGNIKVTPPAKEKKKQVSPAKNWGFTANNYTEQDILDVKNINSSRVPIIVFQKEIGPENLVPHLQGFITFKQKDRPMGLGLDKKFIWKVMHKKSNPQAAREYCVKTDWAETAEPNPDPYCRGWNPPPEIYIEPPCELLQPLVEAMRSYKVGKGDRIINYIVDRKGGLGKTEFCRWAINEFPNCIISGGKAADMKNQIVKYSEKHYCTPSYILIDCPRSLCGYLSYTGIEEVKNMLFYSGKYEGAQICGNKPFVVLLMNEEPLFEKCSADRWKCLFNR